MNETDGRVKSLFSNLEDVFPGYTYYLIGYSTFAFFTPTFESAIFGQTSALRQALVVFIGAAIFVFLYRSTYARVIRQRWGDSSE